MDSEKRSPLEVRGLCKQYPSFMLDHVSFSLVPGEITGFIGRNGAGKTTTINSVLSLIRPDEGEVLFSGLTFGEHENEIKEKIGFVSAGMTYYTRKSLKKITEVVRSFYPGWNDGVYRNYMNVFGLSEDKTPAALSNGMKIKYALTLALSHGADLLILDEPTSGLDPVSREELIEIFLNLKDAGKTVFFSTHITSDLEKCADRILFLQNGRLRADERLDDFRGAWAIAEAEGELPADLAAVSRGVCRTRGGYTVLLRREDAGRFAAREASLDEIMVHLEKTAEEEAAV